MSKRPKPAYYSPHQPYAAAAAAAGRSNIAVHAHDVLNGRGVNIAQHPGNERFRTLVNSRRDERYCSEYTTNEKRALAQEVIDHIRSLNPPGRFLKRSGRAHGHRGLEGPWEELSEKECIKKTCQALRDCNRNDREGYAAQVRVPEDVEEETTRRSATGLTLKEHAAAAAASSAAVAHPPPPSPIFSMTSTPTMARYAVPKSRAPGTEFTPRRRPDHNPAVTPSVESSQERPSKRFHAQEQPPMYAQRMPSPAFAPPPPSAPPPMAHGPPRTMSPYHMAPTQAYPMTATYPRSRSMTPSSMSTPRQNIPGISPEPTSSGSTAGHHVPDSAQAIQGGHDHLSHDPMVSPPPPLSETSIGPEITPIPQRFAAPTLRASPTNQNPISHEMDGSDYGQRYSPHGAHAPYGHHHPRDRIDYYPYPHQAVHLPYQPQHQLHQQQHHHLQQQHQQHHHHHIPINVFQHPPEVPNYYALNEEQQQPHQPLSLPYAHVPFPESGSQSVGSAGDSDFIDVMEAAASAAASLANSPPLTNEEEQFPNDSLDDHLADLS